MHDPDYVWMGDECIHPSDPRNIGPEWERLTADFSPFNSSQKARCNSPVIPPGFVYLQDIVIATGFHRKTINAMIQIAHIIHRIVPGVRRYVYPKSDIDRLLKDRESKNPRAIVSLSDAARMLGVTRGALQLMAKAANAKPVLYNLYIYKDLEDAMNERSSPCLISMQ